MYDRIRSNKRKTIIVVTLFAFLVVAVASIAGYALFGSALIGGIVGGLVGLIYITISVNTASGSMMKRAGAKQVTADQGDDENIKERQAYNIVSQLAMMQRLPEPEVYVIEDDQPNAFAAGLKPENAKVAVTTGLLERLNRAEIEGVIAHEIAHIQNYDSRLKVTTFALGGLLVLLGHVMIRQSWFRGGGSDSSKGVAILTSVIIGFVILLFGRIIARLIQFWVSRKREYLADTTAAEITRNPQALASALEKISGMEPSDSADSSMSSMYFVNPFKKDGDSLWSTHPSTENRIEELNKL